MVDDRVAMNDDISKVNRTFGVPNFLLGLAIVDDIGAIIIIAAVYSTGVSFGWLLVSIIGVSAVVVAR